MAGVTPSYNEFLIDIQKTKNDIQVTHKFYNNVKMKTQKIFLIIMTETDLLQCNGTSDALT